MSPAVGILGEYCMGNQLKATDHTKPDSHTYILEPIGPSP